jgi:hypothetical protein
LLVGEELVTMIYHHTHTHPTLAEDMTGLEALAGEHAGPLCTGWDDSTEDLSSGDLPGCAHPSCLVLVYEGTE